MPESPNRGGCTHARHPAVASDRPLVFAHRGGSGIGPENTLAAFDRGLAAGADGLECDVHLSRDEVVVVHHDPSLDRTTDASGPLAALTAGELARVNAAFRFDGDHPPVGIPTLREVLARYPGVRVIVEVKGGSATLARATVEEIRGAGALDRVSVGAFSRRALAAARSLEPRLATGAARSEVRWALYRSRIGWPIRRAPYQAFHVPARAGRTRVVSRRFVRAAHRAGLAVQVWTVDDPAEMRRLLDWGVDAIITDRPDLAVPTVKEWFDGQG